MEVLVIYPICWRTVYGSLPYMKVLLKEISNINNKKYCYPIYDVDESIYLIYGDDNPPIIG